MAFNRSALLPGAKYLDVLKYNAKTKKHENVRQAVSTMSDAELKAALLRPTNQNALASGWTISNGNIVRAGGGAPVPESHADPVNTGTPGSGIGSPQPAAPTPPPPAPTQAGFAGYQDAQYWMDLSNLRQQLGLVQNPDGSMVSQAAQARLAQLGQRIDPTTFKPVTGGVGGQTLYDILYAKQQQDDARNITLSRSDAAKKGVLSSGYNDQQLTNLAGQSAAAMDGLVRNYGTDLNDSRSAAYQATQQQADLLRQYQQAQGSYAQAASQRGYQDALNRYQQQYGGY